MNRKRNTTPTHRCTCRNQTLTWGSYYCYAPMTCQNNKRHPIPLTNVEKVKDFDRRGLLEK
jgi:hypothetical protein